MTSIMNACINGQKHVIKSFVIDIEIFIFL